MGTNPHFYELILIVIWATNRLPPAMMAQTTIVRPNLKEKRK
jgi:hypothetical protein